MYHANKRRTDEHYKRVVALRIKNTYARFEGKFWNRVNKTATCWNWTGCKKSKSTYGKLSYHGKNSYAHRVSWILANGEIPMGLWVLHKCDNPACVRPDHLYLGTHEQNTRDAVERKRMRSGPSHPHYGNHGEKSPTHKLTAEMVKKIRTDYIPNVMGIRKLGNRFGVTPSTIAAIVNGKTWRTGKHG